LTAGRRGFERGAARHWLFLGFSHCHTVIRVADFATGGGDFFKLNNLRLWWKALRQRRNLAGSSHKKIFFTLFNLD